MGTLLWRRGMRARNRQTSQEMDPHVQINQAKFPLIQIKAFLSTGKVLQAAVNQY